MAILAGNGSAAQILRPMGGGNGHAPPGAVKASGGLTFLLDGPPIPIEQMPVVCADFDTIFYLKTQFFNVPWQQMISQKKSAQAYWVGKQKQARFLDKANHASSSDDWKELVALYGAAKPAASKGWKEIKQNGSSLYYDDTFNEKVFSGKLKKLRPKPGTVATKIALPKSSFEITPYVWDHMNTPFMFVHTQDALDDQNSGGMQRITAFSLRRKGVGKAKRTLIVGSAGEMTSKHTTPKPEKISLETDLLIQAVQANEVQGTSFLDHPLKEIMQQNRSFTFRSIAVNDFMVYSHFEEFVSSAASRSQFKKDFKAAIHDNIKGLRELIKKDKKIQPVNRTLLKDNRIFVLKRFGLGFEQPDMPTDASCL
jgi:hypothetical protein